MNINERFTEAVASLHAGNLQSVDRICRDILQTFPGHIGASHLLGVLAYQRGDFHESIELLKKAVALSPDPDIYTHLGSALTAVQLFDEAILCYRRAIALNPRAAETYFNMGNAFVAAGKTEEAVDCYRKASEIRPDFAAAHVNLANVLRETGRDDEALEHYETAIKLDSVLPDAHYNMGTILQDKGRFDEAILAYKKAFERNPRLVDACYNLGMIFQERQQFDEAMSCYRQALSLSPDSEDIYNNMGVIFHRKGVMHEAISAYQKAIQLNPSFSEAYSNLGNTFQEKGQWDDAIDSYRRAIEINPRFATAYNNLGNAFQEKGRFDEAIDCHRKAVEINPSFREAYSDLGAALQEKGIIDEAITCYRKALQLNPCDAKAYSSLGTALQDKGLFNEAMECHNRAIEILPSFAEAHWNMSLTLLSAGYFSEGWEKYEWRLLKKDARPALTSLPKWDGRPLEKSRIIITAEQGIGDEIMFSSCLPELLSSADTCFVECDRRLVPLFTRSFPEAAFFERIAPGGDSFRIPAADVTIPIGSLPRFFRKNLSSFPGSASYLKPDDTKKSMWYQRLEEIGKGLRVGISWRGGSKPGVQLARSTILSQWSSLLAVDGIHFVNLQYGNCGEEIREVRKNMGIIIHDWEDADPLKDLDGFAAQVSSLDLVISIDNATVHMAGALGIPVWAMLPHACDWRWMRNCEETPWYPSARLFRQASAGEWQRVMERVQSALEEFVEQKKNGN